jgi:ankyrin repeat protein
MKFDFVVKTLYEQCLRSPRKATNLAQSLQPLDATFCNTERHIDSPSFLRSCCEAAAQWLRGCEQLSGEISISEAQALKTVSYFQLTDRAFHIASPEFITICQTFGYPIYCNCIRGDSRLMTSLLNIDSEVPDAYNFHHSAVSTAAKFRNIFTLIKSLDKLSIRHRALICLLESTVAHGQFDTARLLITNTAWLDNDFGSALHIASSRGHVDSIAAMLDHGAEPDNLSKLAPVYYALTPLICACIKNQMDAVFLLVGRGAAINANSYPFGSPLQAASLCGHGPLVQRMIQNLDADPNMSARLEYDGYVTYTPLSTTVLWKRQVAMKLLIYLGATLDQSGSHNGTNGVSPLCIACIKGRFFAVTGMLSKGARPDYSGDDISTPIQTAFDIGEYGIVQELQKFGAIKPVAKLGNREFHEQ